MSFMCRFFLLLVFVLKSWGLLAKEYSMVTAPLVQLSGSVAIHHANISGEESKRIVKNKLRLLFGKEQALLIEDYSPSLFQLTVGHKTYFVSNDGALIFGGPILNLDTRVNIVEEADNRIRQKTLSSLSNEMSLRFLAQGEEKGKVTVFTDIDCTFCRKLHGEMSEYNRRGITVDYVMLPRNGVQSESFNKAVSVFCDADPQGAMNNAMKGETLAAIECSNTVEKQLALAISLGISSTPTLVLPSGKIKMGFIPPADLSNLLLTQ